VKTKTIITLAIIAISLPATLVAQGASGRDFELPATAQQIAPGVFYLGASRDSLGRLVDGFAFVYYRTGNMGKPDGAGGGPPAPDPDPDPSEDPCFAFILDGLGWNTTEGYLVDTASFPVDTDTVPLFGLGEVSDALETWNAAVSGDIFGVGIEAAGLDVETASPDDTNEVLFGTISNPNVIAATTVWAILRGPPQLRGLVEWDAIFSTNFNWGNDGNENWMDFLNIATHEFGHAAGLDHPADTCVDETMFAFASNGETKKSTLHAGDVAGIQTIYGAALP